jgi:hypothetical protein
MVVLFYTIKEALGHKELGERVHAFLVTLLVSPPER